jgi:hypothetical protein
MLFPGRPRHRSGADASTVRSPAWLSSGSWWRKWTLVTDPANHHYAPTSYTNPAFFIPQQSGYPAWFAVRTLSTGGPTWFGTQNMSGEVYLVFTKKSAGARWIEVLEPGGLPAQAMPQVATQSGYATQLSPADANGLALAPAKLPGQQVAYLDASNIPTMPPRPGLPAPKKPHVINFANGKTALGDLGDVGFWKKRMPAGSTVRDVHATTEDEIFALRTTNGGALVFYDLSSSLLLATPNAAPFTLKIPGIFDGKQMARTFTENWNDQFAVYEPPGTLAHPTVLATDTAPVSGECDGAPCA